MSAELNRRAFIGLASGAAIGVGAGVTKAIAQSTWVILAEVLPVAHGFHLRVSFGLGTLPSGPLYLQIADSEDVDSFFDWVLITESSGTEVKDIGPFGLPYGRTYVVSIVEESGDTYPLSPVVEVGVPAFPEATIE